MPKGKTILDKGRFAFTMKRLCHQLIENYDDFDNTCIIGVQEGGAILADRLVEILEDISKIKVPLGKLDISFFRDDYRRRDKPITPSKTIMDFIVEDKKVILVDDVLYTGRTIHAAISALQNFGRAGKIELLVFVDRRFNRSFPIKSDYTGITVDAIAEAYVKVEWAHIDGKDQIKFYNKLNS